MKRALPVATAAILLAGSLAAQTVGLSPQDEASAERAERTCRLTVQGQTAKARDDYVQSCVSQTNPTFSYWEHCRQKAQGQHLEGIAFRDDIAACMAHMP